MFPRESPKNVPPPHPARPRLRGRSLFFLFFLLNRPLLVSLSFRNLIRDRWICLVRIPSPNTKHTTPTNKLSIAWVLRRLSHALFGDERRPQTVNRKLRKQLPAPCGVPRTFRHVADAWWRQEVERFAERNCSLKKKKKKIYVISFELTSGATSVKSTDAQTPELSNLNKINN